MPYKPASATKKTLASFGAAAAVLLLGLLAACGGGSGSEAAPATRAPVAPPTSATVAPPTAPPTRQAPPPSVSSSAPSTPPPDSTPTTEATLPPEEVPDPNEATGLAGITESLNEVLTAMNGAENESETLSQADIRVVVADGDLVEGESRYEISQGESIVIEVYSEQFEHEVHVHGYDLTDFAGPISPARFEFVADLAGTWEVEFEETHELIFELVVS